jgi:DNA-binding MarR family transcriptional regulator
MKPYQPDQPLLPEDEMIHTLLAYMITELPNDGLDELVDPGNIFIGVNRDNFIKFTMHRMVSENLITTERSRQGRSSYVIRVTPHGIRVAHHLGGYRSYHAEQQNAVKQEIQGKLENERVAREAAQATIDAAESARVSALVSKRSLTISKVAIAVPSVIAIAAIVAQVVSNNNASADLELAKSQIKELQQQVKALSVHK